MNYAQQLYKEGMEKGAEQGRQEGKQQAQIETMQTVARNMLQNGSDIEFVKKVTGLTTEEIKKLQF